MKRTINFSGFLLVAFASALLMMVWPMNADAQGWRRSVVKLCKNITKAELASGHYKHATASLVKNMLLRQAPIVSSPIKSVVI